MGAASAATATGRARTRRMRAEAPGVVRKGAAGGACGGSASAGVLPTSHQPHFPDAWSGRAGPLCAACAFSSLTVWMVKLPRARIGQGKGHRDAAGCECEAGDRCSRSRARSHRDTVLAASGQERTDKQLQAEGARHACAATLLAWVSGWSGRGPAAGEGRQQDAAEQMVLLRKCEDRPATRRAVAWAACWPAIPWQP